jgi:hypothetical protein
MLIQLFAAHKERIEVMIREMISPIILHNDLSHEGARYSTPAVCCMPFINC